ncbi:MAG TPA: metal ABC transporter substrate-binding protein [Anaerohalosphaeraceae bacterium]|jgi:ABC-type Zn uptake system ZnuABC Zn-binding protein ZnuA|nr:metal ABC transporter substrate-binding protein [Anaerohalosphaeraceae bacterium]HRT49501.1 metal ABC transporter substrate-binding protein [Anaerohalosphaeraceae bacterium]HRT85337.1 metal ABC transporter substrate-binding protein [Anaerohalosphaeraceae bacterium]
MSGGRIAALAVLCAAALAGGCTKRAGASGGGVAVTNSYLASAVRDVCGEGVEVFCLAAPGMCPGHFDLSPEQLGRLAASRAFLRFDFQGGLDGRLARLKTPVLAVEGRPGMCVPQTYAATCAEVLEFLTGAGLVDEAAGRARLDALRGRLDRLEAEVKQAVAVAQLEGAKVVASRRQADFARWLGLDVVGVFAAADVMTPGDLEACLRAGRENGVRLVIANLQEGTQLPEKIAHELGARPVLFSNFPETEASGPGVFEAMVRSNVANLVR